MRKKIIMISLITAAVILVAVIAFYLWANKEREARFEILEVRMGDKVFAPTQARLEFIAHYKIGDYIWNPMDVPEWVKVSKDNGIYTLIVDESLLGKTIVIVAKQL